MNEWIIVWMINWMNNTWKTDILFLEIKIFSFGNSFKTSYHKKNWGYGLLLIRLKFIWVHRPLRESDEDELMDPTRSWCSNTTSALLHLQPANDPRCYDENDETKHRKNEDQWLFDIHLFQQDTMIPQPSFNYTSLLIKINYLNLIGLPGNTWLPLTVLSG